jgi:hypothetical protein
MTVSDFYEVYTIDLIDKLKVFKANALLQVTSKNDTGNILFNNGKITHVNTKSGKNGSNAFDEILNWNDYSLKKISLKNNNFIPQLSFQIHFIDNKNDIESFTLDINNSIQDICDNGIKKFEDILAIFIFDFNSKKILGEKLRINDSSNELHKLYLNHIISITEKKKDFSLEKIIEKDSLKEFEIDSDLNKLNNESYSNSDLLCVCKPIKNNTYISVISDPNKKLAFVLKEIRSLHSEVIEIDF